MIQNHRQMEKLIRGLTSKSEKMRALAGAGYARADIARFLGTRYQFVRNVLVQEEAQVLGGTELPLVRDLHQIDAATFVLPLQFLEQPHDVRVGWQRLRQRLLVERLGGGEQKRLDNAQMHGVDGNVVVLDDRRLAHSAGELGFDDRSSEFWFDNLGHVGLVSADDAIHDTVSSAP